MEAEEDDAEASRGGQEYEDPVPPERRGEEAVESVCVGEEEQQGHEKGEEDS